MLILCWYFLNYDWPRETNKTPSQVWCWLLKSTLTWTSPMPSSSSAAKCVVTECSCVQDCRDFRISDEGGSGSENAVYTCYRNCKSRSTGGYNPIFPPNLLAQNCGKLCRAVLQAEINGVVHGLPNRSSHHCTMTSSCTILGVSSSRRQWRTVMVRRLVKHSCANIGNFCSREGCSSDRSTNKRSLQICTRIKLVRGGSTWARPSDTSRRGPDLIS